MACTLALLSQSLAATGPAASTNAPPERYERVSAEALNLRFAVKDWKVTAVPGSDGGKASATGTATVVSLFCGSRKIEFAGSTVVHVEEDRSAWDTLTTRDFGPIRVTFSPRGLRSLWLTNRQRDAILKLSHPAQGAP